jgi:hypothetical protein
MDSLAMNRRRPPIMKREISPTSAADRGGRSIMAMAFAMACASGPSGCGPVAQTRTTSGPVAQAHAVIDAKPERARRDRIDGIQLVSINGTPAHGTKTALKPGRNTVRVRFAWPQGGTQEADLAFYSRAGQQYFVQYDAMPPYTNRLLEPTSPDEAATEILRTSASAREGFIFLIPPAVALWSAGFVSRSANEIAEKRKPAHYMDLRVISRHNGEGIVRTVRAYPDGRNDAGPWDAWAQMSPR